MEVNLQPDGSIESGPNVQPLQDKSKAYLGVFEFSFIEQDSVKVVLREDACSRKLGTPRRRTHQIACLKPWKPVRILLNGRIASTAGQFYRVLEYLLVLCDEAAPETMEEPKFVDLQADLA